MDREAELPNFNKIYIFLLPSLCTSVTRWLNGRALVFGTKGCGFESHPGRLFLLLTVNMLDHGDVCKVVH